MLGPPGSVAVATTTPCAMCAAGTMCGWMMWAGVRSPEPTPGEKIPASASVLACNTQLVTYAYSAETQHMMLGYLCAAITAASHRVRGGVRACRLGVLGLLLGCCRGVTDSCLQTLCGAVLAALHYAAHEQSWPVQCCVTVQATMGCQLLHLQLTQHCCRPCPSA